MVFCNGTGRRACVVQFRYSIGYWGAVGAQAIGAILIMWDGMPLYREALRSPESLQPNPIASGWLLLYAGIIQAAYWAGRRWDPHALVGCYPLSGHLVSFLGRMPLLFGTAAFGFLFFARPPGLSLSFFEYAVVLAALFSLYCFNQAMERCAVALAANDPSRSKP